MFDQIFRKPQNERDDWLQYEDPYIDQPDHPFFTGKDLF